VKSRFVKLLGLLFAVTLSGNPVPPAHANTNVSAAVCQPFDEQFFHSASYFGVGTGFISNDSATNTLKIVCSVPRAPLDAAATVGQFYVDGLNPGSDGTQTATCVLYSWNYNTSLLGTASYSTGPHFGPWDGLITMPAAQLPYWAYATVLCTLPPGGSFQGVTVVQ
jgi:hypothetical protein